MFAKKNKVYEEGYNSKSLPVRREECLIASKIKKRKSCFRRGKKERKIKTYHISMLFLSPLLPQNIVTSGESLG
jgi:hypothetical protein